MFQTLNVRKISVSTEWAMSCGQDIKLHIYSVSTHKWTSDKVQLTLTFYVSKFFFYLKGWEYMFQPVEEIGMV